MQPNPCAQLAVKVARIAGASRHSRLETEPKRPWAQSLLQLPRQLPATSYPGSSLFLHQKPWRVWRHNENGLFLITQWFTKEVFWSLPRLLPLRVWLIVGLQMECNSNSPLPPVIHRTSGPGSLTVIPAGPLLSIAHVLTWMMSGV